MIKDFRIHNLYKGPSYIKLCNQTYFKPMTVHRELLRISRKQRLISEHFTCGFQKLWLKCSRTSKYEPKMSNFRMWSFYLFFQGDSESA